MIFILYDECKIVTRSYLGWEVISNQKNIKKYIFILKVTYEYNLCIRQKEILLKIFGMSEVEKITQYILI
ncbi:hypothetical protein F8158_28195 [Bacillus cereus]|uniref:Uncharacterized protein n=1 Tax=Bacillus cereus TaxID=1396 RepID=A0AB34D294_BACCE|nr:hypothetical protein F8158_28195 [Bacillus cereus]